MSGSKIAMIRGRTVFAKYCRRAMSTAREFTSENQKVVVDNKEKWDIPKYLYRGGVVFLGYIYGNYLIPADPAEVEALVKKEKDLDAQMKELARKESRLAIIFQELYFSASELEYLKEKKKDLVELMKLLEVEEDLPAKEAYIRKTTSQDKGD